MIHNNIKLLTVCIPTYNRAKYLEKQLMFFLEQVRSNSKIIDSVRFIVSDNASTDETPEILRKIHKVTGFFDYETNESNLGVVGNIIALLNRSDTEYVWFVSDDDTLKNGIIENILSIIKNYNEPEFIFLNYLSSSKKGFNGKSGYRADSKCAALEIYQNGYGSLVFMTACVFRRNNILELISNPMFEWLSAPLLYSFYSCTKGPIFISEEYWVTFHPNNASYSGLKRLLKLKFEEYVSILLFLPEIGYEVDSVKVTINKFFVRQSHSFLLYMFFDYKMASSLLKFYKIEALLKIPANIFNYFKTRMFK